MGSNGYRCSHHPPTPELLDICDRLGMLVLDENRHLSSSEESLKDLKPCFTGTGIIPRYLCGAWRMKKRYREQ